MSLKKQNETQTDSAAVEYDYNLESSIVVATLYERITKDIHSAQKYISITDIIGVLETIKLSVYNAAHMFVAEEFSKELAKHEVKN